MCARCPERAFNFTLYDVSNLTELAQRETVTEYHRRMAKVAKEPYPAYDEDRILGAGARDKRTGRPLQHDGMLVGEAGGISEHYAHRPFVGKTGTVLDAYLRAAGIARPDIWITNVYPWWTGPGNPDPTSTQIKAKEHLLIEDLKHVRPRVIGAVGRVALNWFFPGQGLTLEEVHGIPLPTDKVPGAVCIPIYHPASGFYAPELASRSQEDFFLFSHYLRNPVQVREVPEITTMLRKNTPRYRGGAIDTEGLEDSAWGLSRASGGDGEGEVYIRDPKHLAPDIRGEITFHHALHDLRILRAMGVDTRRIDPHDTMVKAFVLQLEPQSLKALAYRHLGLRMTEFDETVRPHFDKLALAYLRRAATLKYPKPRPRVIDDFAKRKQRIYSPWDAGRRVKSALTAYEKALKDPDKDPVRLEKKWKDLPEEFRTLIECKMGESFPEFSIFCVPRAEAVRYSGTDAAATDLISPVLDAQIKAKKLTGVYEMDRRALKFVDRMQEVGMRVDLERLKELEEELEAHREHARRAIQRIVGDRWFNPGSGDQVAAWLYTVRGLPIDDRNRTDSGRGSTSDGALQLLKGYHAQDPEVRAFIQATQDYREADKYLGTFVERIFAAVRRDREGHWRLHPNFRVTRVVSGRVSETMVMMIPSRTALGKKIRLVFRAAPGYQIVDADLSQIELRIGAHLSGDRTMRQAFIDAKDLHAITGGKAFKCGVDAVSETQRYTAKIVNFATFYGITARALLEQLYKADIFDFTLEDCDRFIRDWFALYSEVRGWQKRTWDQAAVDGFVRDMWGRICYVPNIRVLDGPLQEAAQRLATNFPVQSGVSGFIKRAEIRIGEWVEQEDLYDDVLPWLQMHDELVFEVREEIAQEVKLHVERMMTADQSKLSVPIKAKAGVGPSWGEAKS